MKHLFFILTIILLTSCDSDNQTVDNKTMSVASSTTEKNSLIGHWTICKTISGTGDSIAETSYNVCTIVNFSSDKTAVVIKPSGDNEFLEWNISNNKLILINKNPINKDNFYFDNDEYEMIFIPKKESTELKLTQRKKNYTYVLGGD